ncbi:MAG: hypothetical protein AAF806_15915 [Bacteroidota bacterium]
MKQLIHLINIINQDRLSTQQAFTKDISRKTKLMQLYRGIGAGAIKTTEQALEKIYKGDKNANNNFARLKHDLKHRLLNSVLLIELEKDRNKQKHSKRKIAFFNCMRSFTAAYFLILLKGRSIGIPILEAKLEEMIHYDFTFLLLETTKLLRQHYLVIEGDAEKAQTYADLIQQYLGTYTLETEVEGLYHSLMLNFTRAKADKSAVHTIAKQYYNNIKYRHTTVPSSSLIYKSKMIEIIMYVTNNEFQNAIGVCVKTIQQLKEKDFVDHTGIFTLYLQWINCGMELRTFDQLDTPLKAITEHTDVGSFNWFSGMKMRFRVAMQKEEYAKARGIYCEVMQRKESLKRFTLLYEEWNVFALTIEILIKSKKIDRIDDKSLHDGRIAKLNNSLEILQRDKQGVYAYFKLAWLAFMLLNKDYEQVNGQLGALNNYKFRNLSEQNNVRSRCFLKMLTRLSSANYDYKAIEAWSNKQLVFMISSSPFNQFLEIIPYETLWMILVETLLNDKRHPRVTNSQLDQTKYSGKADYKY